MRPTDEAANGEIVVALLGDEATVKRFYRERNAIRLEPENEAHEPIRTQDAELLGKVIGVFRQVEMSYSTTAHTRMTHVAIEQLI